MCELIKARSLIYKTIWQALSRLADDYDKEEAAQAADERKSKKAKAPSLPLRCCRTFPFSLVFSSQNVPLSMR